MKPIGGGGGKCEKWWSGAGGCSRLGGTPPKGHWARLGAGAAGLAPILRTLAFDLIFAPHCSRCFLSSSLNNFSYVLVVGTLLPPQISYFFL